jgi:hypothetical protein
MLIVKINKWNDTKTSTQTSTIWELAKDELFTEILHKVEKSVDMYVYNIRNDNGGNIVLDKSTKYYLRATRVFNNSNEHLISDIYTINPNDALTDFEVSLIQAYDDVYVAEPTLSVNTDKLYESLYTIITSDFKANRGTHLSTSWFILDNNDDVVFTKMNDTENLIKLDIDVRKEWWNNNDTLRVYAIHTSNLRKSSKAGMLIIKPNEYINYSIELPNYLEFDTNYTIPITTKSNIYGNGVYKVKIYNKQTSYDIVGSDISSINIPSWVIVGTNVNILVHYTTTNGQLYSHNYTIPVMSTGRHLKYEYNYLNQLDTSVTVSGKNTKLDVSPNYQGEFLHNGYIPVVKDGKITLFNLINNDLRYVSDENILVDSEGYAIKYNKISIIRRMSDTLLVVAGTKDNVNVISIYRYLSTSGKYEFIVDYPMEGIITTDFGESNSIAIMNNNEIWYKKDKTSDVYRIKLITGDDDKITTISGLVSTGAFTDENGATWDNVVIEPTYIASNNSLIAVGGHTTTTYRYDGTVELSSKPLYSPQFAHNKLGTSPLINGDSILYKKTNYSIKLSEATSLIANTVPSVSFKTLEEEYGNYKELSDTIVEKTTFNVSVATIETTYDTEFTLTISSNLTDVNSYYVKCDTNLFKVTSKTLNSVTFKVPYSNSKYTTTRYIKLVASKNQKFNQTTYNAEKDYNATVVETEVLIKLVPDTLSSTTTSISTSSGNGYIWFNGKEYHRHDEIELNTYLGNVSFPFKLYGLDADDFSVTVDNITSVVNDYNVTKYSNKLYIVDFNGIITQGQYVFTISDVVGEFLKVRVNVLGRRDSGYTPTIHIRNSEVNIQEPIGFIDKRVIPFTIKYLDNITIVNSNDNLVSIYKDNPYLDTTSNDILDDKYGMIVNSDGIGIFYVKNNTKGDIYSSNYFIYCVIDGTAEVEPGYIINGNTKVVTLSKDYYIIKSDLSRYNNKSIFDIDSNVLVSMGGNKVTLTLPMEDDTCIISTTVKEKITSDTLTDDYISNIITITENEDEYYAYFKNTTRLKYNGRNEDVFLPISVTEKWYELEVSNTNDNVTIGEGLVGKKVSDKLWLIRLNNADKLSTYTSKIIINQGTDKEIVKTIKVVPFLYVINDSVNGDVPIEQYNAVVSSLSSIEYDITTIGDEYIVATSITPVILDDESKYTVTSYYNQNNFNFKIVPEINYAKLIDKVQLWLDYTYSVPEGYNNTALTKDVSQVMSIYLTELPPVTFLKIDELSTKSITIGDTLTLGIKTNGTYKVTSSDESIISVKDNVLTGIKEGYACITVIATKDGVQSVKNELYITVSATNTSTSSRYAIVKHNLTNFAMYTNTELPVTWTTDADSLTIKSSNENIVKYDNIRNVFISANYVGNVTITVTTRSTLLLTTIETFNLTVMDRGNTEPGILVHNADSCEFTNGPAYTTIIPKTSILTKQGYVILADENGKVMLYK